MQINNKTEENKELRMLKEVESWMDKLQTIDKKKDKLSRAKGFPPLLVSSVRVRDLLATEVADLSVCD